MINTATAPSKDIQSEFRKKGQHTHTHRAHPHTASVGLHSSVRKKNRGPLSGRCLLALQARHRRQKAPLTLWRKKIPARPRPCSGTWRRDLKNASSDSRQHRGIGRRPQDRLIPSSDLFLAYVSGIASSETMWPWSP